MRKFIDTLVLILLLLGPAVVLTCVNQDDPGMDEQLALHHKEVNDKAIANVIVVMP